MIELKPCPFCGSRNTSTGFAHPIYMIKRYRGKFVFAGCRDCGATTPLFYANAFCFSHLHKNSFYPLNIHSHRKNKTDDNIISQKYLFVNTFGYDIF